MLTNREDDIRRARQMSKLHAHHLSKPKREPQADTTFGFDSPSTMRDHEDGLRLPPLGGPLTAEDWGLA